MDVETTTVLNTVKVLEADFRRNYEIQIPSTTYSTHGLHSYTAKLIPQIPRFFIEKYSRKNQVIFDPFCGSGTTCVEALITGRRSIGMDINPLAILISKAKTTYLQVPDIKQTINIINESLQKDVTFPIYDFPKIDYWFNEDSKIQLSKIKSTIENVKPRFNDKQMNFVLACFSSIIRKSSLADHGMAKTYRSKRLKKRFDNGWKPNPTQLFKETLTRNGQRIVELSNLLLKNSCSPQFIQGDARQAKKILCNYNFGKANLVVTSPPYINAQDYFRSYKLELLWLGLASREQQIELNKQVIGTEQPSSYNYDLIPKSDNQALNRILKYIWNSDRKNCKKKAYIISQYFERMDDVFKDLFDILQADGIFCLVTGNNTICKQTIPTYEILMELAENRGFRLRELYKDKIANRWLFPDRNHECGTIKEEWITVFQKC